MPKESLPYIAGCDADDSVLSGVVGGQASEYLDAKNSFPEVFLPPGYRLFDDVFEKLPATIASAEGFAFEDFLKMTADLPKVVRKLHRERELFSLFVYM
ncbi:hypothetical protein [Granulicella mallensis]|jgi:hypothetical protein|uniref:Uncharacterized protein n=1 Tax=Granulicella mallensis TaxID=940614 RepID=A0A7W7ZV31_9BACT|nr:hypothetical protein [Granulicella mallensis]MBB5066327.1 hypothetical protein [Granulicella mallensis]